MRDTEVPDGRSLERARTERVVVSAIALWLSSMVAIALLPQRMFTGRVPIPMERSMYRQQQLGKLDELIKNIRIAMLTTLEDNGCLRSRPMATPQMAFHGELWFFTLTDTAKVVESQQHRQVNVSFADPERQDYISISGTASLVYDRQKMQELWSPWFSRWFPLGLKEPNLTLLKVDVERAEYWDAPSSTMVQLYEVVKATLTGKASQGGEHAKLVVDERQAGT